MNRSILLAAALLLASCATPPRAALEPVVQVVEVKVPVAVYCAPDLGPEPAYADSAEALSRADIFEAIKLLLAGRDQRIARDQVKTAGLDGCRPPPQPG